MIADIIIIVIVILFIILGVRRGFARTLLNFLGTIFCAFLASTLSDWLAQWIYKTFLQQSVLQNIERSINENGASYAISNSLDALPKWLSGTVTGIFGIFGAGTEDVQQGVSSTIQEQSHAMAQAIEEPLGAIVIMVFSAILMLILFILLMCIVKFLVKRISRVFEIPVIKQINHFLGGFLGAAEGIVFVWVAINLFYVIMMFANPAFAENKGIFGSIFHAMCVFMD